MADKSQGSDEASTSGFGFAVPKKRRLEDDEEVDRVKNLEEAEQSIHPLLIPGVKTQSLISL